MEKSSKRGKIPQADWPLIMARYEAGETLASIARTYDCSPPAISYVVSRSRSRQAALTAPAAVAKTSEPQLIKATEAPNGAAKTPVSPTPGNGHAAVAMLRHEPVPVESPKAQSPADPGIPTDRHLMPPSRDGIGHGRHDGDRHPRPIAIAAAAAAHPAGNGNGDARRTLHLSLGQSSPANGGSPAGGGHPLSHPPAVVDGHHVVMPSGSADRQMPPAPPDGNGAARRDGAGPYIDKDLRARVDGDIAAFLAAFDAALVQDTLESRSALRE